MSQPNSIFVVHLTFSPDKLDYVKATFFEPAFGLITAEPDNFLVKVLHNPQKPGSLTMIEGWKLTPAAYMEYAHKQPWFAKYIIPTEEFMTEPRRVEVFEEAEGLQYVA